jgi:crotonobetainyl-CoA:carnitine CoA-transferase CaiB-like acyl-CoA transferase
VFTVKDGGQVFLAAVSDTQWALMCDAFGFEDLKADARLASNNARVQSRAWMLPLLRERFAAFDAAELAARFDRLGLPYAPITRPQDLFDDPHLAATGGLAPVTLPPDTSSAGREVRTRTALLPLTLDGRRPGVRAAPPALGQHTEGLLAELGYAAGDIERLRQDGVIGTPSAAPAPQA